MSPPVIAEGLFSFDIGGSERVGADLATEFAARGYRVICFAFYGSTGPVRNELEARRIQCVDLNYLSGPRYIRRITYPLEFWRFAREYGVTALHVHHATALVLCGLAARVAGIKRVVMTEHALHQLQERPNYLKSATYCCRYATSVTTVEAGIADYFHDVMHVGRDRLHVVTNGVRIGTRSQARRTCLRNDLGVSDSQFLLLFAGRLEAVKDVDTLLRALALLPGELRQRVRLVIAGDGSQRKQLEEAALALGIAHITRFLGMRTDVAELLAAADAFILTSITEGLPMALIEAMAAEVPCIATAVGGIPELFAGGAGVLVPPRHPHHTAAALVRVINDDALRARVRKRGLEKTRSQYQLEGVVSRYLALLGLPERWSPRG